MVRGVHFPVDSKEVRMLTELVNDILSKTQDKPATLDTIQDGLPHYYITHLAMRH